MLQGEVVHGSPPRVSQHARRVCVVHHHDRTVPLGGFHQRGQGRNIAIHRKHAIGDEQLVPAGAGQIGQDLVRGGRILVREDMDLGPR